MSPVSISSSALFFFVFLLFSFSIRLFSPVRRLRRAQVLYRAQLLDREQIPPPGERALCPERNTPVVAQYPVIAPFSSTKVSKRSGIERMAFHICSVLFWFSQATALRTRVLKAFCSMGA